MLFQVHCSKKTKSWQFFNCKMQRAGYLSFHKQPPCSVCFHASKNELQLIIVFLGRISENVTFNCIIQHIFFPLSLNTPPGTKIKLLGTVEVKNGCLLLDDTNTVVLGGEVEPLIEKWELQRVRLSQITLSSCCWLCYYIDSSGKEWVSLWKHASIIFLEYCLPIYSSRSHLLQTGWWYRGVTWIDFLVISIKAVYREKTFLAF